MFKKATAKPASAGPAAAKLREAGLRPTRQRLVLAELLFGGHDRHVTAEELHQEALARGARISLATIYNALNQFTAAKLLREVAIEGARTYFDTNTADHFHFYLESEGKLMDIENSGVTVEGLPLAPQGKRISRIDVIVRLTNR
ncbi:MAG TPA: Fur family transcriptional regulator [Aestuariivirgaceae bacterium]|jgi:Fur family iron response transcriptional regulator